MRVKTRSGQWLTIPDDSIIRQEKHVKKHEVYYVIYCDEFQIQASQPVDGYRLDVVDHRRRSASEEVAAGLPVPRTELQPRDEGRISAADCSSAGGAFTASKPVDVHAAEKVKGETFFTHKSDSGLVIRSPKGEVIHETKVQDMYKRR